MVTESEYSLKKKRERKDSTRRAEVFLVCSVLFHVILLGLFSLLTIDAASKPDKPLVIELAEDRDDQSYEFNDFPQKNETDKEVDSPRLSDKNRLVDRETVRRGTPLGGGSPQPPGAVLSPPAKPDQPDKNENSDKPAVDDRLVARKQTRPEPAIKPDESVPRPDKERLTVEDLTMGRSGSGRLDQPFGTTAPGVTEEEEVSLNTTEFKYYAYFAHIKRQIELAWSYPYEAQKRDEGGRLTLVFTIESGGNVSSVTLIRSSGYQILDEYAIKAVRYASPFNPIPASIGTKRLRITANFEYITSLFGVR
jgi:TonB family protein